MDITSILEELRQDREKVSNAIAALENHADHGRDTRKFFETLQRERQSIEDAVLALENLARARGKRRGRRPAWISEVQAARDSR